MVLGLVWMAVPAAAQPCEWSALGSGMNDIVNALTVFDRPVESRSNPFGRERSPGRNGQQLLKFSESRRGPLR